MTERSPTPPHDAGDASGTGYRHEAVSRHLRTRIEAGELRPGDRLPSFAEMYRRYGTTQATVNRAYAELEQAGLIERRRGSGVYVADASRRPRTGVIGVVGWGLSFSAHKLYWATVLDGIRVGLHEQGWQLLMVESPEQFAGWHTLDGALVIQEHHAASCVPATLPQVAMLWPQPGMENVVLDDFAGTRAATQHLLYLGHRRIGFACFDTREAPSPHGAPTQQREAGYRTALREAGIEPDANWLRPFPATPGQTRTERQDLVGRARQHMSAWLADPGPAGWAAQGLTAVVAFNDAFAQGILHALQDHGLDVPGDVSVTGFDGLGAAHLSEPALTTVEAPLDEIGRVAAHRLARRMDHPRVAVEDTVLPVHLRVRASTGPAPRGD